MNWILIVFTEKGEFVRNGRVWREQSGGTPGIFRQFGSFIIQVTL